MKATYIFSNLFCVQLTQFYYTNALFGWSENKNEWKVRWMKIGMIIFSFLVFGWSEKWKDWNYERSSFFLFDLIEKWDK